MSTPDADVPLSRTAASAAVEEIGWRNLLGNLCASVPVGSLGQAASVAAVAVAACGADADRHLRVDLRPDRVELSLRDQTQVVATTRDTELAHEVTTALAGLGVTVASPVTSGGAVTSTNHRRPVEMLEIAIDALDIPAIMPFWRAVLGYTEEPGVEPGAGDALYDPAGQLPALWFQQMDAPRPQRNRIHFDITVSHEEAGPRIAAALAAGGRLINDAEARAFWVLADAEGNEICVCTWQDRDHPEDRPARQSGSER